MLHRVNPLVAVYKQAIEFLQQHPPEELRLVIRSADGGADLRLYNAPTEVNEVAAIMIGDGENDVGPRDIVVSARGGDLQRVSELHAGYDPLHYVLLFPRGEPGWSMELKAQLNCTLNDYFAYRMMVIRCT